MATPILPDNADQEIAAIQTDVKAELPTSNPWIPWSDIRAEIVGIGKRIYSFYYHLGAMFKMFFPSTSRGVWRDMWASFRNIAPVPESKATGYITATGIDTSEIAAGQIVKVGGVDYEVDATVDIAARTINVTSITRSGTTAICICDSDHELATGMSIPITGATESEWNDTFGPITVTDTDRFTFEVATTFTTPATGSPQIDVDTATVSITSSEYGAANNLDSGVQMLFESEILGVDELAYVQFGGITGGADADNQDDINSEYNQRINNAFAKPVNQANPEHIKRVIMGIDKANTRVWVHRLWNNSTREFKAGYMSIFFVRDGDTDIIPSASYVSAAKEAVIDICTANVSEDSVFVNDTLDEVSVGVTITSVVPNTTSMKNALAAQVDSFFRNFNDEGVDFSIDKFRGNLYQTWDSDAGERIGSFTMVSPASNIDIEIGQIPTPGTVSIG